MFYVYKIMNKTSGKSYVGKAADVIKRLRNHLKIARLGKAKYPRKFHAIHAAIVKYGIDNFVFDIIETFGTEEESFTAEKEIIQWMKENKLPTYNLSDGGEGNAGWHHTPEARSKMSKARKGKKFSEEHKEALSKAQSGSLHSQYGKHQTIEWKEAKGKLTAKQVKEIRNLLVRKVRQKTIAEFYLVSPSLISQIKCQRIWPEVLADSDSLSDSGLSEDLLLSD